MDRKSRGDDVPPFRFGDGSRCQCQCPHTSKDLHRPTATALGGGDSTPQLVEIDWRGQLLDLLIRIDLFAEQILKRRTARDLGRHNGSRRRSNEQISLSKVNPAVRHARDEADLPGDSGRPTRSENQAASHHSPRFLSPDLPQGKTPV
jgi:hypothetical protein